MQEFDQMETAWSCTLLVLTHGTGTYRPHTLPSGSKRRLQLIDSDDGPMEASSKTNLQK